MRDTEDTEDRGAEPFATYRDSRGRLRLVWSDGGELFQYQERRPEPFDMIDADGHVRTFYYSSGVDGCSDGRGHHGEFACLRCSGWRRHPNDPA